VSPIQFDNLFKQHRQRVYGYAYHYLGDEEDAADVTQEVFIRMWRSRRAIEEDRVVAWLLRVARNLCVDVYRRRSTRHKYFREERVSIMEHPDHRPQPDRVTAGNMFDERLKKALDKLGEPHRSIVVLREIQEYKYEEISEALELPLNTVKVYLHRARRALREELSEDLRYEYV
jgi:RNA polymerase sigma-70 factor, ECF subfamily